MTTRHASRFPISSALLAGLFAFLAGCTTPTHRMPPDDGGAYVGSPRHSGEIPGWAHQELSWNKLREIERWSSSEGLRASDHWRTEAKLVAAEGRLVLAQREPGNAPALRQRLTASRRSFDEVRSSARSSEMQRIRAKRGLDRIQGFATPQEAASPRVVGPMIPRSAWGARPALRNQMTPSNHRYTRITVHHSADYVSTQLDGTSTSSARAIKKIQRAHMEGQNTGWADIGYHFLIDPQGRVFEGRQLRWQGAHASGKNNVGNIGICLLGNFEKHQPTEAALGSLEKLVGSCRSTFGIAKHKLHGHKEFKSTACPGKHLSAWVRSHR